MKKLILILCAIFLVGSVSAQEKTLPYDLGKALNNIGVEQNHYPKYLPGARETDEIKKANMGKPYIITYYIQEIATALTGIAAAVAVLFIIQNSFSLLTSAGGSEVITKAKKGLMWSLIGLVLIMGSYILVKTIIALPYAAETTSLLSHQFFT